MNFNEYLHHISNHTSLTVDATWGQGRTTFGGLSAALLLHKIEQNTAEDDVLRSLSINFCGPLLTEQPCDSHIQTLRVGKSVSHYQGQVLQDEQLVTQIVACFSKNRESSIMVDVPKQSLGAVGEGRHMPYIKGITPEFTQHIDFSYNAGGFPFTNSKDDFVHGWMRFKGVEGLLSNAHLVALIDAWPPATCIKLKGLAPMATVTWNLEVITPLTQLTEPLQGNAWLWYEVDIIEASHGYGHTQAKIYAADGTLLAVSSQLVVAYS